MSTCPIYHNCAFLEYLRELDLKNVSRGFQNLYCKSGKNNCERYKLMELENTTQDVMPNRMNFPNRKKMINGEKLYTIKKDLIKWNKDYHTNEEVMDKYHLKIIILINLIETQYKMGRPKKNLVKLLKRLNKLNEKHYEEELSVIKEKSDQYDSDYLKRIKDSYETFNSFYEEGLEVNDEVNKFLSDWILRHIHIS